MKLFERQDMSLAATTYSRVRVVKTTAGWSVSPSYSEKCDEVQAQKL